MTNRNEIETKVFDTMLDIIRFSTMTELLKLSLASDEQIADAMTIPGSYLPEYTVEQITPYLTSFRELTSSHEGAPNSAHTQDCAFCAAVARLAVRQA